MVATADSKSVAREGVWVRLPPRAPYAKIVQWLEHPVHTRQVVGSNPTLGTKIWGISSFRRASALQAEGEGSIALILHHKAHYHSNSIWLTISIIQKSKRFNPVLVP